VVEMLVRDVMSTRAGDVRDGHRDDRRVKEEKRMDTRRVLLVEADPGNRQMYGAWLEEGGYEVLTCPGPTAPDYACVGGLRGGCPLVEPVDVVVLDLDLDSEIEEVGTSAFELLSLYTSSGKPVVAVGSDPRMVRVFPERAITGILGPPTRPGLVQAIGESIAWAVG
jgi:CheY-like chemotaxis protein